MKLVLNPGDVICPECKGAVVDDRLGNGLPIVACSVCHSEGKFDWIENIVGKNDRVFNLDLTNVVDDKPINPIEGCIFFDETSNGLKVYVNGKWSDTKIGI